MSPRLESSANAKAEFSAGAVAVVAYSAHGLSRKEVSAKSEISSSGAKQPEPKRIINTCAVPRTRPKVKTLCRLLGTETQRRGFAFRFACERLLFSPGLESCSPWASGG